VRAGNALAKAFTSLTEKELKEAQELSEPRVVGRLGTAQSQKGSSMETYFFALLALAMGMLMSVYLPMNTSVSKYSGSPFAANASFYLVGLVASIAILAVFGDLRAALKLKSVPPYLFLTGVMSNLVVLSTIFLIPRFGARKAFVLLLAGQVIMAIIVSHFGLLESPKDPITVQKLVGAALLILGAIISMT
jgi:transporter family-2 protein